jgi:hypothetical protein
VLGSGELMGLGGSVDGEGSVVGAAEGEGLSVVGELDGDGVGALELSGESVGASRVGETALVVGAVEPDVPELGVGLGDVTAGDGPAVGGICTRSWAVSVRTVVSNRSEAWAWLRSGTGSVGSTAASPACWLAANVVSFASGSALRWRR